MQGLESSGSFVAPPEGPAPFVDHEFVARLMPSATREASLFGQHLVRRELVTEADVETARRMQLRRNQVLGLIARARDLLTANQVREIVEAQKRWGMKFGEAALKLGYMEGDDLAELLLVQRQRHLYIGECLVLLGAIERETMEEELVRYLAQRRTTAIIPAQYGAPEEREAV